MQPEPGCDGVTDPTSDDRAVTDAGGVSRADDRPHGVANSCSDPDCLPEPEPDPDGSAHAQAHADRSAKPDADQAPDATADRAADPDPGRRGLRAGM